MTTIQYKIPNYSHILYLIFFVLFVVVAAFWTFLFIDRYNLINQVNNLQSKEQLLEYKLQNVNCTTIKLLKSF